MIFHFQYKRIHRDFMSLNKLFGATWLLWLEKWTPSVRPQAGRVSASSTRQHHHQQKKLTNKKSWHETRLGCSAKDTSVGNHREDEQKDMGLCLIQQDDLEQSGSDYSEIRWGSWLSVIRSNMQLNFLIVTDIEVPIHLYLLLLDVFLNVFCSQWLIQCL